MERKEGFPWGEKRERRKEGLREWHYVPTGKESSRPWTEEPEELSVTGFLQTAYITQILRFWKCTAELCGRLLGRRRALPGECTK